MSEMFLEMRKAALKRLSHRNPREIAQLSGGMYCPDRNEMKITSLGKTYRLSLPEYSCNPELAPWHYLVLLHYMDLADSVFDYCYEKREEWKNWLFWSPVEMMLGHEKSHQEVKVKQDIWIKHVIEKYSHDEKRMDLLFSAIGEWSGERRKKAIEKFLSLNDDPHIFERLPLESSHWGGIGSMIPYMQERIEYLRSLLPLVSGIKYLKQKQRIEREVDCWKQRIHSEEVRELLESWYR